MDSNIRRVAILFAGGPAPAANAVISTAAVSFLRNNIEVIGVLNGYSHLVEYAPDHPMQEGRDYIKITHKMLKRTRNSQGILDRHRPDQPGQDGLQPRSPQGSRSGSAPLRTVYEALVSLEVDALISIGGDDTLKTANKFKLFQEQLPPGSRRIPVVHLPKTIDNDYSGIDFTFGYFTAVETLAEEIRNLLADAEANRSLFPRRNHGPQRRLAGLRRGDRRRGQPGDQRRGHHGQVREARRDDRPEDRRKRHCRRAMNIDEVVRRIVATMRVREEAEGKEFGVDRHGRGSGRVAARPAHRRRSPRRSRPYRHLAVQPQPAVLRAGRPRSTPGRPARSERSPACRWATKAAAPGRMAFDVMLGSQLGVGAYRALVEKRLDGVMVSTTGQLELLYVPFEKLVDPQDAGHGRSLYRARFRFPSLGAVPGNLRQRVSG